jgi:hypothetical protein
MPTCFLEFDDDDEGASDAAGGDALRFVRRSTGRLRRGHRRDGALDSFAHATRRGRQNVRGSGVLHHVAAAARKAASLMSAC